MDSAARPQLVELSIADPAGRWADLGFAAADGVVDLGGVRLVLGAPGAGIVSWSLLGIDPVSSIDGLATTVIADPPPPVLAEHPNGAVGLDHVVVLSPEFDRTAEALATAGLPLRRVRSVGDAEHAFRQGFRRLGSAILELVEARYAPAGPARFWGLVVIVSDLDALAAMLGAERVSGPKSAVQPGRRIATLRESGGLSMQVAFMDPEPA